jgi:hypothetical protein
VEQFKKKNRQLKPLIEAQTFLVRYANQVKYYLGWQKGG